MPRPKKILNRQEKVYTLDKTLGNRSKLNELNQLKRICKQIINKC